MQERRQLQWVLNRRPEITQLPASQRPVPAQLPASEREAYRKLPFENMHNFRELGGLSCDDGRRLRWGMIYRADKICGLGEEDQRYLERLGLRQIVDFRSDMERDEAPHTLLPGSQTEIRALPITVEAADIDKMIASLRCETTTVEQMEIYLIDANREMIERFTPVYRDWVQGLLKPQNYPQVFHCTAGKDRTGLAAALLLRTLGVSQETVIEDYLATNHYTAERIDTVARAVHGSSMFQVNEDVIRTLFSVRPQFIAAAFDAIDHEYGNFDRFLELGLGVTDVERQYLCELLLDSDVT